ncbi:MerR family transcriptional regulator [Rhizobium laguerreae]|nr:MerR family transcriptional regulator [Rhizobium laguerreae]
MNHKKQFYRIAEAADRVGVSASTLRLWEKQGLIVPDRSETDQRRYDADHIARLKYISELRKYRGLNAAAIFEVLKVEGSLLKAGTLQDATDADPVSKRVKQLEDELALMKRTVADLMLKLRRKT